MKNAVNARQGFDKLGQLYPPAKDVAISATTIAGISCHWFVPADAQSDEILFFIHGGAFIYGSIISHTPLISHLATAIGRKMLYIDYRLAPEHPFPDGLLDIVRVIMAVLNENKTIRYGIIGDSAGGNLAMSAGLSLKDIKVQQPAYYIAISPFLDLECKSASYITNKDIDPILTIETLKGAAATYAGGHALSNPLVSPVNGDFSGLNPVLLLCGSREILEGDSSRFYERLKSQGIDVTYQRFENEVHVWPMQDIASPGSQAALNLVRRFANKPGSAVI